MFAEPRAARYRCTPRSMFAGSSKFPRVAHHVGCPSFGSVVGFGSGSSRWHQGFGKLNEWFVQVRKIADFRQPIVHLKINIQVIITIPGCLNCV